MRIAQLAPLAESVPPKLYGGTERVVAWLVDELVELGHDVTLFASGGCGDARGLAHRLDVTLTDCCLTSTGPSRSRTPVLRSGAREGPARPQFANGRFWPHR